MVASPKPAADVTQDTGTCGASRRKVPDTPGVRGHLRLLAGGDGEVTH